MFVCINFKYFWLSNLQSYNYCELCQFQVFSRAIYKNDSEILIITRRNLASNEKHAIFFKIQNGQLIKLYWQSPSRSHSRLKKLWEVYCFTMSMLLFRSKSYCNEKKEFDLISNFDYQSIPTF